MPTWALIRSSDDRVYAISETYQVPGQFEHDPIGEPGAMFEWVRRDGAVPVSVDPNWDDFAEPFTTPGHPWYDSVFAKVEASGAKAIDHWGNVKLIVLYVKNENKFCAAIQYTISLLEAAGNPLSQGELDALITMLQVNNFTQYQIPQPD